MNKIKWYIAVTVVIVGILSASCSEDNKITHNNVEVSNPELKAILMSRGYNFNEAGQLVQDEKVLETISFDLSGTKIASPSGLDIFPNLKEVNLSNNAYGPLFDFSVLPGKVTAVDLTGNQIYDFEGLVNVKVVNDEQQITILHTLTKLYLPETAKYNVEDLVPFYESAGKSVEMKMEDDKGILTAYNTLREIPDTYFRAYLKMKFASLFPNNGQLIDISKPMSLAEQGENIVLWDNNQFEDIAKIQSIEGLEYFVNNPYYKSFFVSIGYDKHFTVSRLAPRDNVRGLQFSSISTPDGLDLSKARNVANVALNNDEYLTELDLSATAVTNQEIADIEISSSLGNMLRCTGCKNLKQIKFPSPNKKIITNLTLANLPALESLDLSSIEGWSDLELFGLENCTITYPDNLKYYFKNATGELLELSSANRLSFTISEDVFKKPQTRNFISRYKSYMRDGYTEFGEFAEYPWSKNL